MARSAAWPSAADPHHAQCRLDGGRRTPPKRHRTTVRRDRKRDFRPQRVARQTRWHGPHNDGGACGRDYSLAHHGEVNVEITIDYGLTDIVAERYDAGVRLGEVAKDMTSVRIEPDFRMAVVAAPSYFEGRRQPLTP
jgi:hypothetical protein